MMTYDHFVAICHPLHYTVLMNPQLCRLSVLVSWLISVLHSLLESLMMLHLAFCTVLDIPPPPFSANSNDPTCLF